MSVGKTNKFVIKIISNFYFHLMLFHKTGKVLKHYPGFYDFDFSNNLNFLLKLDKPFISAKHFSKLFIFYV